MTDLGTKTKNILGIDTAILSGSIALYSGQDLLQSNDSGVARSELLIGEIAGILRKSHITAQELDVIAVSAGPGSFTGIRIGIATALGLGKSVSADCYGVPVFDAFSSYPGSGGRIPILPLGRRRYAVGGYSPETKNVVNSTDHQILDENELLRHIAAESSSRFIFPKIDDLRDPDAFQIFRGHSNVAFCRENIAQLVCIRVLSGEFHRHVSPIYAQR